jgi:hypothetical protein
MSVTRKSRLPIAALLAFLTIGKHVAQGAEGAASYYFPGSPGSFAVATAPLPGFTLVNQTLFYSASASRAVLSGRALGNLEVDAVYDYLGGLFAIKPRVAGAVFAVGSFVPVGRASLEASLTGPNGATTGVKASDFNIGDMLITPAALYWSKGSVHLKVGENIIAPTGHYDVSQPMNVGRNYWGFDSVAALTYLNMKRGFEASVSPGIEFNTRNPDTDYHTGNEFHTDFMINQFLSKNFALGVQAYYYNQVSPDTGTGAKLGDFEGNSFGWGPALLWSPKKTGGRLNITAKWMQDVHAENRLRGRYAVIVVAFKL